MKLNIEDYIRSLKVDEFSGISGDYIDSFGQLLIGKIDLFLLGIVRANLLLQISHLTKKCSFFKNQHAEEAFVMAIERQRDYIYILWILLLSNNLETSH